MRPYRSYSPDNGELVSVGVAEQCDAMLTNAVYARRIPAPHPARTTLQAAGLPLGAKVQLDAVATVGSPG
ncbi:RidA family protein [Arthrobacter sp. zg-Y1219]|uniref:RidA family protein n=1 Tax=Arthrobacter sp. zg-Y1219 TaxID=3049067 RepID=UPI0024C4367B|nr:RidA family protein [Arthrobacter sp. zg-Y1219]MDK1358743.1 RidA family protein [Arthrobacter sp. zg-Y1219]